MKTFKEFIVEEFIVEVLDSEFQVRHSESLKKEINKQNQGKIYPAHTAAISSDHMKSKGLHVVRIMNNNHEIEYHLLNLNLKGGGKLPNDKQDKKATLHAIKIIHDDAKFHLNQGRNIRIQSANSRQHKIYTGIANHLIKDYPTRKITQLGMQPRIDGEEAETLIIENISEGKINWIEKIKEYEKNE